MVRALEICILSKRTISHFRREAWHSLGDMTKLEAVGKYLATVSAIDPAWETLDSTSAPTEVNSQCHHTHF